MHSAYKKYSYIHTTSTMLARPTTPIILTICCNKCLQVVSEGFFKRKYTHLNRKVATLAPAKKTRGQFLPLPSFIVNRGAGGISHAVEESQSSAARRHSSEILLKKDFAFNVDSKENQFLLGIEI